MYFTSSTQNKKSGARILAGAFGIALSCFSASALALQPLITDDTGTQGTGGNQLEFSYNRDRARSDGETERTQTVPVVYTYGLTETLDLFAATGYSRIRTSTPGGDASGFGNLTLGGKWRFLENEETGTSLGIKPEIALPVSSSRETRGLGTGKTSGNLTFILSQELPFGAIHVNAGIGRDRFRHSDENPDTRFKRFSVAPVWDVTDQWKLALDRGVESARADGQTTRSRFVEVGAIYSPDKNLDLAIGAIRTADNAQPKTTTHSLTAGVTWRF